MTEPGRFEVKDKDVGGRIGKLYTPSGILETPALLPVIDPIRQDLELQEIERLGFKAVITNAYLLWKRMPEITREKGVHGVLGFNGIVMTDSGAYQILQYGRVAVKPEEIVEFQKQIGSDIAVILDIPTGNARSRRQAEYSVEETLRRAREALSYIDPDKRVWVIPIQGGQFPDLLERSAKEAAKLLGLYKVAALGSPTVLLERYDYATLIRMIAKVRETLPWGTPLHLFGAGHPMIIPFAVALGVDLFDSASYILYARDNRYMTRSKTYRLEELEYLPCSCPVCNKYTPRELLDMPQRERSRLLALHNLHVLRDAINEVKQAIREGRLWELIEERSRAHPSLARALREITRHSRYLVLHSPRLKGGKAKGVLLVSPESTYNPKILQHQLMLIQRYRRPQGKSHALLIPVEHEYKPFTRSRLYRSMSRERDDETHILGYSLYIGVVPEELAETYPLSQFEINDTPYVEVVNETAKRIAEYITNQGYEKITVVVLPEYTWSRKLAEALTALIPGVEVREAQSEEKKEQ